VCTGRLPSTDYGRGFFITLAGADYPSTSRLGKAKLADPDIQMIYWGIRRR
jgi:hypothetical protein